MSSPTPTSQNLQQRQSAQSTFPSPLTQSRETGDAIPQSQNAQSMTQRPSPVGKSFAHFVAGAAGGMTSSILTAPLDVLKTRLQSDFYQGQLASARAARGLPPIQSMSIFRSSALHIRETFQILVAVPRIEGWRALFKGLGPNLIGVVPARAINFFAYGNGKRIYSQYLNDGKEAAWVHLMAGATAGIITGTATCPIWVVKTRLQLDKSHAEKAGSQAMRRYKNALDCTLQTFRHEGIRGLYRGLGASYLGVTESTFQWVLYERFKKTIARRQTRREQAGREATQVEQTVDSLMIAGSAGVAKGFAAFITYPHEVVRTRLRQAPMENGRMKYTSIVQCVSLVWKEEGMAAMYGGLIPHMLRAVPSAVIMFGVYEWTLRLLGTTSKVN